MANQLRINMANQHQHGQSASTWPISINMANQHQHGQSAWPISINKSASATTWPEQHQNGGAPEPTDRPYVPQNRPLRPLSRQTCVNLPTHLKIALEVEIVQVCGPVFRPTETHQQHGTRPCLATGLYQTQHATETNNKGLRTNWLQTPAANGPRPRIRPRETNQQNRTTDQLCTHRSTRWRAETAPVLAGQRPL